MKLHEIIIQESAPMRMGDEQTSMMSIYENVDRWRKFMGLKVFSYLWPITPRSSPRGRASYRRQGNKILPYIVMPEWYKPFKESISQEFTRFLDGNDIPFHKWKPYGITAEFGFPYPETVKVGGKSIKVRDEMIIDRKPTTQKSEDCDNLVKALVDSLVLETKGVRPIGVDDHELFEMMAVKTRNPTPYIRVEILVSTDPNDNKNLIVQY